MTVRQVPLRAVLTSRAGVEVDPRGLYPIAGVYGFGRGILLRDPISGSDTQYRSLTKLTAGDVVYSKVKAFEGAVTVTPPSGDGRYVSPEFPVFAASGDVDPDYLRHVLAWEGFLTQMRTKSSGIGARRERVSPSTFLSLEVPLPPIEEQRRIAAYLDHRAGVAECLVVRAKSHDASFSAVQLPRVAAAWIHAQQLPRVRVADLVDSVNDTIHPGDDARGASEFVGLEHVEPHTGRSLGSRPVGDETGRKFRFEENDVTFGYLRPYLNKVWAADRTGLCSVEQFVLRPVDSASPHLVAHLLRSSIVLDAAVAATNRLQLPRLRLATLMGIEVPDIRVAAGSLLPEMDALRDRFVHLAALRARRRHGLESLLQAARNEVFSSLR